MKIEFSTINRLQIAVQSYGICTDATSRTPCHRQPGCCPVPARVLASLFLHRLDHRPGCAPSSVMIGSVSGKDGVHLHPVSSRYLKRCFLCSRDRVIGIMKQTLVNGRK